MLSSLLSYRRSAERERERSRERSPDVLAYAGERPPAEREPGERPPLAQRRYALNLSMTIVMRCSDEY